MYVTTALSVRIIDFNPIGGTTSALLFTWAELGFGAVDNSSGSLAPQAADESPPSTAVPPTEVPQDTSIASWPLRVVARGGAMQAGSRVACGMPFDMLSLQGGAANIASPSPPQGEGATMSIDAIMAMVEAQSRQHR